jgi:mono/diheme cytochrome c family protein
MIDWLTAIFSAVPWPFSVRPSVTNLADPEMRRLVATALSELGFAVLLLAITTLMRRGRIVAVLVALPLVFTQAPSLALLLVPATPASYHRSPTGFTASSIAFGRAVFAETCVTCHGKVGDGSGGRGAIADLRAPHIWSHPAGDLFWFVSHGIDGPDGAALMPAFEATLPERTRWSLIDYVHALNAGAVARGLGGWPGRVPAPSAAISCSRIPARSIAELRGKAVRIILGALPAPLPKLPPVNGIAVVTVWVPGEASEAAPAADVDCVAQGSTDAATAYAVLAGSPNGKLIPARFLIDPEGVLRSVWHKGDGDDWSDRDLQLQEVRTICTETFAVEPGDEHEHHR